MDNWSMRYPITEEEPAKTAPTTRPLNLWCCRGKFQFNCCILVLPCWPAESRKTRLELAEDARLKFLLQNPAHCVQIFYSQTMSTQAIIRVTGQTSSNKYGVFINVCSGPLRISLRAHDRLRLNLTFPLYQTRTPWWVVKVSTPMRTVTNISYIQLGAAFKHFDHQMIASSSVSINWL